jgi:hypothetical protein
MTSVTPPGVAAALEDIGHRLAARDETMAASPALYE